MTRPLQCLLMPASTFHWTLEELVSLKKAWIVLRKALQTFVSGIWFRALHELSPVAWSLSAPFFLQREVFQKGWVAVAQRFVAHCHSGHINGAALLSLQFTCVPFIPLFKQWAPVWALIRQADKNSAGKIKEHPFQILREMTKLELDNCKLEGAFSIIRSLPSRLLLWSSILRSYGNFSGGGLTSK